jgi:hypothetical protein
MRVVARRNAVMPSRNQIEGAVGVALLAEVTVVEAVGGAVLLHRVDGPEGHGPVAQSVVERAGLGQQSVRPLMEDDAKGVHPEAQQHHDDDAGRHRPGQGQSHQQVGRGQQHHNLQPQHGHGGDGVGQ